MLQGGTLYDGPATTFAVSGATRQPHGIYLIDFYLYQRVIQMFDVAIIGAGPAGTAAAFDLLSNGLKVLLLDKYEFPRKKACAGGITPKGYHLFRYDISSVVKRECRTVRIRTPKGKFFDIKENVPLCYMTQREELDLLSLTRVIEKGGGFQGGKTN